MCRQVLLGGVFALLFLLSGFFLGQHTDFTRYNWQSLWQRLVFYNPLDMEQVNQAEPNNSQPAGLDVSPVGEPEAVRVAGDDLSFPSYIGHFTLEKLLSGEEALELSQRIHGDEAPLTHVNVAFYRHREEQVILWVFELESLEDAASHLEKMNIRLKEEGRNGGRANSFYLKDEKIYHAQQLSMDNYYYKKDRMIFWLSLASHDPVSRFLTFYQHF